MAGRVDEKKRAKLAAELDKDGRWFQKAARRYHARGWVRDMRLALGIGQAFLMDETQVSRKTLYLAEQREESGAIQIAELEALAEAMECKLVYAIVPKRGTVAELAEERRAHPRKTRTVREKESREYREWYAKEVERIRMQNLDPTSREILEWGKERERAKREGRDKGTEGQGTEGQGTEGQGTEGQGTVGQGTLRPGSGQAAGLGGAVVPARGPGAQRIRDAVAGAMKELGPEAEQEIRKKAGKMPWDQPGKGLSPASIELLKLAKEEWEKRQGTGNRDQGPGNRD